MPLRITPSVAEQEGQQTETEATGAPQKHHYTLNQQVGSITDDIKSWRYNISHGDAIEGAGLSLTAANLNNMRLDENRAETGFFIKVRDIHNPEWQIHFFPKEGSFKSQKGIKNLEKQMSQWMEVFDQIVNENKG